MDDKESLLEEELHLLQQRGKEGPLSLCTILQHLKGKGEPLLVLLLSLPFCQPLQIPGFSTPFGIAIAFIGLRMAFGKDLWLPKKALEREISPHAIQEVTRYGISIIRKIKPWIHPRWKWVSSNWMAPLMNGIVICLLGFFLALPLPIPMSNIAAAWALLAMTIGLLEDDGLLVLVGYGLSLITLGTFFAVFFFFKSLLR